MFVEISDPADPRLDDFRRLNDTAYRVSIETARPVPWFVAEGATVVGRLVASGLALRAIVVTEHKRSRMQPMLEGLPSPGFVVPQDVLDAVAGFNVHRGVLAAAVRPEPPDPRTMAQAVDRVAVVEGLNDHENLGAVLRSAAALGIGGVILDPTCADPFYRRSVRVSMGAAFMLPIVRSSAWPADLTILRAAGYELVALTPKEDATDIAGIPSPPRAAILLGAEGPGLSAEAMSRADWRARIPMTAGMDSLNVGHAAAVAFWALRPRRTDG